MLDFTASDFQRVAVSAIGALTLSAACVFGAVGPARAEAAVSAPVSMAKWQAQVERQIDAVQDDKLTGLPGRVAMSTVVVTLDGSGKLADVNLVRSSGSPRLDQEALRTAGAVRYPALPAALAGSPRTVAMKIFFGRDGDSVASARKLAASDAADANARVARAAGPVRYAAR